MCPDNMSVKKFEGEGEGEGEYSNRDLDFHLPEGSCRIVSTLLRQLTMVHFKEKEW